MCGERQATELDHVPPLSQHVHVEGSGCCRSLPACGPCQREQGAAVGWNNRHLTPEPEPRFAVEEPDDSPGPGDARWDVPWLDGLRDVPSNATWPRFMTAPHPDAVGSYGADAVTFLRDVAGIELRWWQELALTRQLEHDADGTLVWLILLLTTARQVGKSVALRGGATWRLHQAPLFGEQQTIMHTGKDLPVCKEVQRLARSWAKGRGYPVREQNGNEEITEPESGSRWMVRGKQSVYGYSVGFGVCDEAWGVAAGIVEDGLEPTMAERVSPQLVLASTAHNRATTLVPTHRTAALAALDEPESTLLVEWSAHRDADIEDRDAWRAASPFWSRGRERLLESRVARVRAGETLDPDELDPVESFRSQFLNVWPLRTTGDAGAVLIDADVWASRCEHVGEHTGRVFVAVEDHYGRGAAVAAVAPLPDGRYELDAWMVDDWALASADIAALFAVRDRGELTVGPAVIVDVDPALVPTPATPAETRAGLALLRQLVAAGLVVHEGRADMEQLTSVHVRELPTGLTLVAGHRADLTRAAAWALLAAHQSAPAPAIH
jgi:hypothetical protein